MESKESGFREWISRIDPGYTKISEVKTLQVNLGDLCNLSCTHCHQSASPLGSRIMSREVMEKIAGFLSRDSGITLDITGGAPELHPDFRYFMELTSETAAKRILRSNLAVMAEPGMEWLPEFCRTQGVTITASLPCYLEDNVDSQRGNGVYLKSIRVIRELNRLGYGREIELNLVYNPGGRFLPPSQRELEAAYKVELFNRHGIIFSTLYTITNAPVGRFREQLEKDGKLESYLRLLAESCNPSAAGSIMCCSLISVDWQGYLYNCDFNQATGMNMTGEDGAPLTVFDSNPGLLDGREIMFGGHCYCCTAGEGSSCSGALVG
jgi:radical SAM/Cys-rich protein